MKLSFRKKKPQAEMRIFPAEMSEDQGLEKVMMPNWMMSPVIGTARLMRNGEVFNAREMRLLGQSPSAWQCKKMIADAVVSCDWEILPNDLKKPNREKMQEIKDFIRRGAREGVKSTEPYNVYIFSTMMDILDFDAGTIVKVFGAQLPNRLVKLHSRDGSTIYHQTDPYGNIIRYWQYDYTAIMSKPIPLEPREIAYMKVNSRSDSTYGESPQEQIKLIIQGLQKGIQTHELIYRKGGIPSGILALEGMNQGDFDAFKIWWQQNMKNKVYQRAMLNVPTKWVPLVTSFRDLEFLETQHWFTELVYRQFKVPHRGIGAATREAKGVPEEDRRMFMKETVLPYLKLIEDTMNNEIIPYLYENGTVPDCHFHYTLIDLLEETTEVELWQKKWDSGAATINEYRLKKGLDKLAWGEFNPMMMKQIQQVSQSWWYGAFSGEMFEKLTGIEGSSKLPQQIQPQAALPPPAEKKKKPTEEGGK